MEADRICCFFFSRLYAMYVHRRLILFLSRFSDATTCITRNDIIFLSQWKSYDAAAVRIYRYVIILFSAFCFAGRGASERLFRGKSSPVPRPSLSLSRLRNNIYCVRYGPPREVSPVVHTCIIAFPFARVPLH